MLVRTLQFCLSTNEVETCLKSGFPLTAFMSQPIHFAGEVKFKAAHYLRFGLKAPLNPFKIT